MKRTHGIALILTFAAMGSSLTDSHFGEEIDITVTRPYMENLTATFGLSRVFQAEGLAELEPQRGSLWHAYRRKWATERKHLPDVDVATAGGWKTVQTLQTAYQQADAETMFPVVMEAGELREAK